MRLEKDYAEFLGLLNKNKVRYLIVGAYAVGFYGYPRFTKDLDILIDSSSENAEKLLKTLKEFGMEGLNLQEEDITQECQIIQLGYEPIRIDILTSLEEFKFSQLWKNKKSGRYGEEEVFFIGLNDLIKSKKRTGRDLDLIDLKNLVRRNK